jgi:16S rRNA processing protein RimM
LGKNPQQEHAIRPEEVRLGSVNGVFGVHGEVRLFLHNRESDLFAGDGFDVTLVSPSGERQARRVRSRSGAGKRVLGKIEGVASPDLARSYMGWEIVCAPDALPTPEDDEYYHRDLVGLKVEAVDGTPVGTLTEVLEGDVVDCWQIKTAETELIVPAVKQVVVSVDLEAGVITINNPLEVEM